MTLTTGGNINIPTLGARITGDFTNATVANRVAFQTSTANSATSIYILPSGTSPTSQFVASNNSDPTNASVFQIQANATETQLRSGITGTGTFLPLTMYTSGSERLRITTTGNVGIGTTSPSGILTVVGSGTVSANNWAYILGGNVGSTNPSVSLASGVAIGQNFSGGNSETNLVWGQTIGAGQYLSISKWTGSAVTEQLRITSTGNVGIGTTSPSQALDVAGNIISSQSITIGTTGLYQAGSIYSDTNFGMIFRAKQASPSVSQFRWTNSINTALMDIDASGNLLVNTGTSIAAKLAVKVANGGNAIETNNTSGTGNYNAALFYNNGSTLVGYISIAGTTASYASISDYRLKENIAPMTGALAKVSALKPVTYNWKSDGSNGQGFIAHELAEVVPDCVTGEKDAVDKDGKIMPQGIDTSFLVATLTAAIQELKAEFDAYKATHP
jgi:hypothetical protein